MGGPWGKKTERFQPDAFVNGARVPELRAARESARFSDDMADITVSAGKRVHAKPVRPRGQEGDAPRLREPRAGAEKSLVNMSIEAMAFLATPVLQQSQVKRVVGAEARGSGDRAPGV